MDGHSRIYIVKRGDILTFCLELDESEITLRSSCVMSNSRTLSHPLVLIAHGAEIRNYIWLSPNKTLSFVNNFLLKTKVRDGVFRTICPLVLINHKRNFIWSDITSTWIERVGDIFD